MTSCPDIDIVTDFAKEIAGRLPITAAYEDVLSLPAKQTGQIFSDIVKTIQLALAPFQFAAAGQDRLREFIDRSVRRVPKERRQPPAPQILGPVIEGVRYEPKGTPIDQMFSELLSSSIDSSRAHEAHPAYPMIIRQLSADEAKILECLNGKCFDYVETIEFDSQRKLFIGKPAIEVDSLPKDYLIYQTNLRFYFDHLNQLGLAGIFQQGNQEPLFDREPRVQTGVRRRSHYRLTDLGQRFVGACTSDGSKSHGD